jgi:hypothetical protein
MSCGVVQFAEVVLVRRACCRHNEKRLHSYQALRFISRSSLQAAVAYQSSLLTGAAVAGASREDIAATHI